MKISEFSTDKAADILCELTPEINDILTDAELRKDIQEAAKMKAEDFKSPAQMIEYGMNQINKFVPYLLKRKRKQVFSILAILEEKEPEEIGRQNIMATMAQIREICKDKELLDFFKSCTDVEGGE